MVLDNETAQIIPDQSMERLESLTADEMKEELKAWASLTPTLNTLLNQLMKFRAFADNAEELQHKIELLKMTYQGTIDLKERQIKQLTTVIEKYQEDPIGVGFHIDEMANATTKLN